MANSPTESSLKLPFSGQIYPAKEKKFQDMVLLVPFFKAQKSSLKRHIDFLNDAGYDVAVFSLKELSFAEFSQSFFSSQALLGLKHIWADQIESVLNNIAGPKIIFSFSNPSSSAIEAIARRHATDIKGLVCDSGPTANLFNSILNYFTYEEPIRFLPLKVLAAFASTTMWSPHFLTAIRSDLEKIPDHFKVLSIRGWKDKIITPNDIDQVFEPHMNIDWQRLSLPKAAHLNGLKDHPEEYKEPVLNFLKSISSAL